MANPTPSTTPEAQESIQARLKEIKVGVTVSLLMSSIAFLMMFDLASDQERDLASLYVLTLFGILLLLAPFLSIRGRIRKLEEYIASTEN